MTKDEIVAVMKQQDEVAIKMTTPMMMFQGVPVYANPLMTKPEEYVASRTWWERLFTLPWRPWRSTETRVRQVPMREIYRTPVGIIAHPEIVNELLTSIKVKG